MRLLYVRVGLLAVVAFAYLAPAQQLTEEQASQVIARVGDEVITAGEFARDLQYRVRQLQSSTGKAVNPDARFRRALMNELIGSRILNILARNANTKVPDDAVEKEFADRKEIFDSEEAYEGYLKRLGLTEDNLKENIRSRLRVKAFVDEETGEITASEEELAEAYDTLKAQGAVTRTEVTRDIAVILLRAKGGSDDDWRAAEDEAVAVRARIVGGEVFQDVAREVSDDGATAERGGELREMKKGTFYSELEAVMDTMKVGEVSEPVRSVLGWYLITVLAENEPGIIPLEKIRESLEQNIIDTKRREKISEIVKEAQLLIRVEMVEAPAQAPEDPAVEPDGETPAENQR